MKVAESKAIIVTINAVEASFPETSRVPAIFENCIRDTLEKAVVRLDDGPVFRRSTMKVPNFPFALHILLKFKCLK